MWAFLSWLFFSFADWLGGQAPLPVRTVWQSVPERRQTWAQLRDFKLFLQLVENLSQTKFQYHSNYFNWEIRKQPWPFKTKLNLRLCFQSNFPAILHRPHQRARVTLASVELVPRVFIIRVIQLSPVRYTWPLMTVELIAGTLAFRFQLKSVNRY